MKMRTWLLIGATAMGLAACGGSAEQSPAGLQSLQRLAAESTPDLAAETKELPQANGSRTASATVAVTADAFFDWSQRTFPESYPGNPADQSMPPYVYRYYPATQNYLAVNGQLIYLVSPANANQPVSLGKLSDYTCKIYPQSCTPPPAGDTIAPTLALLSPSTTGTYTSPNASLTISGTASDNVGVMSVTWSNNRGGSGTATVGGTATAATWSANAIALQTGTNSITVSARDAAGNTGTGTLVVTYGAATTSTYYLSPTGSNAANCMTATTPCKTFAYIFSRMTAGDEVVLLDGAYSAAAGTGSIQWNDGANSAQIPSGSSVARMTTVRALHPGSVKITGGLFIGRSTRKDRFIKVQGISFEGAGDLYNTDHIYIKDCGFHSQTNGAGAILNVGTNDGEWGNTNALFEDVWVWGKERVGILVYRANNVVVRRAVVRNDGCDSHAAGCGNNSGNSMVGTTIYNSHHVSFQNVVNVDNVLGAGGYDGGSDIQTAWHDNFFFPFGANEWLGNMSINSQLGGMYPEVDDIANMTAYQPLFTYRNTVVVGGTGVSAQTYGTTNKTIVIDGLTVLGGGNSDAFRIAPEYASAVSPTNYVRNVIATGPARFGMNSAIQPSFVSVSGNFTESAYNQTTCATGCFSADPKTNGSLKYITRVEPGSALKGAGSGGADIGANVVQRYGAEGTFFGDAGYATLTGAALWPWPNEGRIKADMCATVTRGFCSRGKRLDGVNTISLTSYVWEFLGNPLPAGF